MTETNNTNRVTLRAFATKRGRELPQLVRITVCGASGDECRDRIRAICRSYGFPIAKTLKTARRINYPGVIRSRA